MSQLATPVHFPAREHGAGENGSECETLQDHHLAEAIARALYATGHRTLAEVRVTAGGGSITLQGRVPSYFLKQLAQEIAKQAGDVQSVHNQILVVRCDDHTKLR
ncbi:MAG TPA: BON domain-containing protein [Gemmataceae bacterium]|nr:BON domain-containing protein [Gemmataceae bacterium]